MWKNLSHTAVCGVQSDNVKHQIVFSFLVILNLMDSLQKNKDGMTNQESWLFTFSLSPSHHFLSLPAPVEVYVTLS